MYPLRMAAPSPARSTSDEVAEDPLLVSEGSEQMVLQFVKGEVSKWMKLRLYCFLCLPAQATALPSCNFSHYAFIHLHTILQLLVMAGTRRKLIQYLTSPHARGILCQVMFLKCIDLIIGYRVLYISKQIIEWLAMDCHI